MFLVLISKTNSNVLLWFLDNSDIAISRENTRSHDIICPESSFSCFCSWIIILFLRCILLWRSSYTRMSAYDRYLVIIGRSVSILHTPNPSSLTLPSSTFSMWHSSVHKCLGLAKQIRVPWLIDLFEFHHLKTVPEHLYWCLFVHIDWVWEELREWGSWIFVLDVWHLRCIVVFETGWLNNVLRHV